MNERHLIDPTPELPDNTSIENIRFPTRLRSALAAEGLKTVGEVRETTDKTLLSAFRILGRTRSHTFERPWACRRAMALGSDSYADRQSGVLRIALRS
jgi:DNA-directed RNA polymerase alpha subunit